MLSLRKLLWTVISKTGIPCIKGGILGAVFFILFSLLYTAPANASHFRFGHITWTRTAGDTIVFSVTSAWREQLPAGSGIPALNGHRATRLSFGDASVSELPELGVNTFPMGSFVDLAGEPYVIVRFTTKHKYATEGPFTVFFESCCRINSLINAGGTSERVETIVDLRDGNTGSPVSSLPVIVQMVANRVNTVNIPIADTDGDSISCRMATVAESSIPSVPTAGGNMLMVSNDCVLTWDLTAGGTVREDKYAAQVVIEEHHSGNIGKVALDFIIEIVDTLANRSPECTGTSGLHIIDVGMPFTANFTGTDPDGDDLMLIALNAPTGSILTPPSGTIEPQPFDATFNWTPAASDAGTAHAINIIYEDPQGLQDICSFSLQVRQTQIDSLSCTVEIISPDDDALVCDDSVKVTATTQVSGGIDPVILTGCDINGFPATVVDDTLICATIALTRGENEIKATCTYIDSLGDQAVCMDTTEVFMDNKPPTCVFTADESGVTGSFIDGGSGIASIVPVDINNATFTHDAFTPGKPKVDFRVEIDNPDRGMHFFIEVTDLCGNTFICDPVYLNLSTNGRREYEFSFPSVDRYLQVTNHGLSEIRIVLNGNRFTLRSDGPQAIQEFNTYFMPREGSINIDMQPYLMQATNTMTLAFEGRSGTNAEVLISDFPGEVDHTLELQSLPETFALAHNYPNPFNPSTKIEFDIPEKEVGGAVVQLRIYNLLGELVRTLVNEHKLPGRYTVEWDGKDNSGVFVGSGMYIYILSADDFSATRKMLLLK